MKEYRYVAFAVLFAGCAPQLEEPAVIPAPRTWDVDDYRAPQDAVMSEGSDALVWGRYPVGDRAWVITDRMIRVPADRWTDFGNLESRLAHFMSVVDVWAGLPEVGDEIMTRVAIWPRSMRVTAKDSATVSLATAWVPLRSVEQEVRCDPVFQLLEPEVRLSAEVTHGDHEIVVRSFMEFRYAYSCEGNAKTQDRLRGVSPDVLMALRAANRRGVAVPLR